MPNLPMLQDIRAAPPKSISINGMRSRAWMYSACLKWQKNTAHRHWFVFAHAVTLVTSVRGVSHHCRVSLCNLALLGAAGEMFEMKWPMAKYDDCGYPGALAQRFSRYILLKPLNSSTKPHRRGYLRRVPGHRAGPARYLIGIWFPPILARRLGCRTNC